VRSSGPCRVPVNPLIVAGLILIRAHAIYAVPAPQKPDAAVAHPRPLVQQRSPVRTCESLRRVSIPETVIDAASTETLTPGDTPACVVTATVTHPAGDSVRVWIGLPLKDWNGRFQGIGGAGFAGGRQASLVAPVAAGYVAGSTDTGHEGGSGSFALDARGRLQWDLIRDFAYRGIHDMTIVGKALATAFFGAAPKRSYFVGCSTGGYQGVTEAQRYPADYDGILAVAPAINWDRFLLSDLWPQLVMHDTGTFVPACKFEAANRAAIAACDGIDGVTDGILDDPRRCLYDPAALVGVPTAGCDPITPREAAVVRQIWDGPRSVEGERLWYGLARGTPFGRLAGIGGTPPTGRPFRIALEWLRFFLAQDPEFDLSTLTPARFEQLFIQAVQQYGAVLGTDHPDLSAFSRRGGRLIAWHGWADELIPAEGSIHYFDRLARRAGGYDDVRKFARLFMAPGVGHCSGGDGPRPVREFEALVAWVEDRRVPETLDAVRRDSAGAVIRARPVCAYPRVARYKGRGNPDEASSYQCRAGAVNREHARVGEIVQ
jgi:Tannase and feruloyl esterase